MTTAALTLMAVHAHPDDEASMTVPMVATPSTMTTILRQSSPIVTRSWLMLQRSSASPTSTNFAIATQG